MTDDLLRYRAEFPILERTTYMISNSLGAMPRGVADSLLSYCDIWATRGVRAWEEKWWDMTREVGDEIGALMNAPSGSVSVHQNVTLCEAVVASCFDFSGRRNKVVYSDMNFPSVMYFWEAQRSRGARVHMVRTDDGAMRLQRRTRQAWMLLAALVFGFFGLAASAVGVSPNIGTRRPAFCAVFAVIQWSAAPSYPQLTAAPADANSGWFNPRVNSSRLPSEPT